MNESIDTLQKCEYCEVYEENDDSYLVKADDIYAILLKTIQKK